jgi:hypothetical protein
MGGALKVIGSMKDCEARMDAETLARADSIRGDPKRMKAAEKAAKAMLGDIQERAQILKRVTGLSSKKR